MEPFTIKHFNEKYPNDNACLAEIFKNRYGNLDRCPFCNKATKFHKIKNRKCYACQRCGYQLHPLADTIFHKSDTPLKSWFYAIFLFANSKNGVSAKEIQRQLGVTYKTAWRIAKQIRLLFDQSGVVLSETVEMDETYVGGKFTGKRGRGAERKTPVVGMVQRKGNIVARAVCSVKTKSLVSLARKNIKAGSSIMTDEYIPYRQLKNEFQHKSINHSLGKFVKEGNVHTNTIEGFWSQLKRSLSGTYHSVSRRHLQLYVDEFAYRYSKRDWPTSLFFPMLARAGMPV